MLRILTTVLICAAAQAATTSTTLNVNAAGTLSGTTLATTGSATLAGGISGTGTFTATISLTTTTGGGTDYLAPFTITFSGGTLTGTVTIPTAWLGGTSSATGSATVSSGTGSYSGDTGSFPTLTGSLASTNETYTLILAGTGTVSTGGTTAPTPPAITLIQNNYSFILPGFPNYGIAPGALFVIQGTGLADPAAQAVVQSSAAPGIPLTLNGASISVTVGGVTTHPGIYYAIAGTIAAVLPAATPVGTGTITVTYNNTPSALAAITVVPAALGIATYNGLAIATNYTNYALYGYTNSIVPGATIVLWGSGLGAISSDSDTVYTATPHAATTLPQIYIGGIQATVLYAGDSGYPGVNQIDVTVPANVSPGCDVSVVAVSGSGASLVTSNTTALAISATGGVCSDPIFGITGTTENTLSSKSTVNQGVLFLVQGTSPGTTAGSTQTSDIAESVFQSVTGASYTSSGSLASVGSCTITQTAGTPVSNPTTAALNAGTITVSGPDGTDTLTPVSLGTIVVGLSVAQLTSGFIPTTGGSFTFRGTGGANVGSLSVTLTFPNPLLNWTNQAAGATVTRAQGATVTWTGGAANSYVLIGGSSSGTVAGQLVNAGFSCFAPVSAGQFVIPFSILLQLPAGTGTLTVENLTSYQPFTATGLDTGVAWGAVSQMVNTVYN